MPDPILIAHYIREGLDVVHCGLKQGLGGVWPSLQLLVHNWSMINAPTDKPSGSWRLGLETCLIRRDLLCELSGIDTAFTSRSGAGLEFGYRCLKMGALVEHRPELCIAAAKERTTEPPVQDLYTFVLRHFGARWAKYLLARRGLERLSWLSERRSLRRAMQSCAAESAPAATAKPVWYGAVFADKEALGRTPVTAIIPTLGRYPYLPEALNSLRRQTIRPREVIVVDQNPRDARQPRLYESFADLNLKVIWQDERGQSLARNTGLAAASCPYVFLFDDDSIAHDDLIEAHLSFLADGRFQVSTGVAYPPPSIHYQLPPDFRFPRAAQTFDTGNSLLPITLARQLGGLDRNYDFGPGTDTDFGTRLYLAGHRIVHNPRAARIHFKAPMGGLRTHGAHKYNTDAGLLKPFPPITQSYYGLRYLSRKQRWERTLLQWVTGQFPKELRDEGAEKPRKVKALFRFSLMCLFLPLKWHLSYRKARALMRGGARLSDFMIREDESREQS